MEDGTIKTNQNGVLKIAENKAEHFNGNKIKKSREEPEKGLHNKLEQLKTLREKINAKLLKKLGMINVILIYKCVCSCLEDEAVQWHVEAAHSSKWWISTFVDRKWTSCR